MEYSAFHWWCPTCGTLKSIHSGVVDDVPRLVKIARTVVDESVDREIGDTTLSGLAECCLLPEDRPK
jgi:hypothetical protein